jgi:hypothetical protein
VVDPSVDWSNSEERTAAVTPWCSTMRNSGAWLQRPGVLWRATRRVGELQRGGASRTFRGTCEVL